MVVEYPGKGFRAKPFQALKGVSIDIKPGETVGLVGESGSGKTTLGRAVLGLAPVTGGKFTYGGKDISHRVAYLFITPRPRRRALSPRNITATRCRRTERRALLDAESAAA